MDKTLRRTHPFGQERQLVLQPLQGILRELKGPEEDGIILQGGGGVDRSVEVPRQELLPEHKHGLRLGRIVLSLRTRAKLKEVKTRKVSTSKYCQIS